LLKLYALAKQGNRRLHFPKLCTPVTPFQSIGDAAHRQHAGAELSHGHKTMQHEQNLVKIARVVPDISWRTETLRQASWFLRPDCAPSSECPQFADLWSESEEWCGRNISGSAHLCRRLPLHGATPPVYCGMLPEWQTSKCISSVSFFRIKSNFFTTHRRHRRKKRWTRILKFEFCDFWEFFEIFKKVSRGPSADDLDHYGRGQTRSD